MIWSFIIVCIAISAYYEYNKKEKKAKLKVINDQATTDHLTANFLQTYNLLLDESNNNFLRAKIALLISDKSFEVKDALQNNIQDLQEAYNTLYYNEVLQKAGTYENRLAHMKVLLENFKLNLSNVLK